MKKVIPEIWKPVVRFEGLYEVSNRGHIKRIAAGRGATPGRILIPGITNSGYYQVHLYHPRNGSGKGKVSFCYIHKLVAEAFLGPTEKDYQVNHIKRNQKLNNRLSNLEYVTAKENMAHARANGFSSQGENNGQATITEQTVLGIRRDYANGVAPKALSEKYNLKRKHIAHIIYRTRWKHI